MDLELRGKVAVVTGATGGIGRAISKALLSEGADVAMAARSPDSVRRATRELGGLQGRPFPLLVDTGDDDSVRTMARSAYEARGRLDILVNCAATPTDPGSSERLADVVDEDMARHFDIKVIGYLRTARAVAPYFMEQRSGRIINISGLGARRTGSIVGSARNVAVAAMTKNIADELGPYGISAVVVHPGLTRTERTDNLLAEAARSRGLSLSQAEALLADNALGRIVTAEEVATVVAFLASPKSVAINGDAIAVGGGAKGAIVY